MTGLICINCGGECYMEKRLNGKGPYCTSCSDLFGEKSQDQKSQTGILMPQYYKGK